jgi:hypothetical protein
MGTLVDSWGSSGRGVNLTTHLRLVPRLRIVAVPRVRLHFADRDNCTCLRVKYHSLSVHLYKAIRDVSAYRMSNTMTIHKLSADKNVRANSSRHIVVDIVSRTLDVPRFDRRSGKIFFFSSKTSITGLRPSQSVRGSVGVRNTF